MLTNLNLCILKSVAYLCIAVWWQYWILSQIPTSVKLAGWGGIFGKTTNSICVSALQCKGQLSSTLIHKIWFLSPVILWSKIFSYDLWKAPSQIGKGISERERERAIWPPSWTPRARDRPDCRRGLRDSKLLDGHHDIARRWIPRDTMFVQYSTALTVLYCTVIICCYRT